MQRGAIRNAWQCFVDLVRQILGLQVEHLSALDQALRIGEELMVEDAQVAGRVEDVALGAAGASFDGKAAMPPYSEF